MSARRTKKNPRKRNLDESTHDNNSKRRKVNKENKSPNELTVNNNTTGNKTKRCEICNQQLNKLKLLGPLTENTVDEVVALADSKLSLETDIGLLEDFRPTYRLMNFSVYDVNDHLCRFDTGLIESNVYLFCCGLILPIHDKDSESAPGIWTQKIGPINEWYTSGYDGGPNQPILISTPYAEYYLMSPAESYKSFMDPVIEKIYLSKIIIEFLASRDDDPTYEDLLDELQTVKLPEGVTLAEESLLKNAQFVCDQVTSFDVSATEEESDDFPLLTTSCMRSIIKLTGAKVGNDIKQPKNNEISPVKKKAMPKMILTKLVYQIVNKFFSKETDSKETFTTRQLMNCGTCIECLKPECGRCAACKKNKSSRKKNSACMKRRCPNKAIEAADSDTESLIDKNKSLKKIESIPEILKKMKVPSRKVKWKSSSISCENNRTYYSKAQVNSTTVTVNDFVKLKSNNPRFELIVKVVAMWEENNEQKAHVNCFYNSRDTILGNIGDSHELFASNQCVDIFLKCVDSFVKVIRRNVSVKWSELGDTEQSVKEIKKNSKDDYYYQMHYTPETSRFEYLDLECKVSVKSQHSCPICLHKSEVREAEKPKLVQPEDVLDDRTSYNVLWYKNEEYRARTGVYINPMVVKFKYKFSVPVPEKLKQVDEELYPEYYRKYATGDHVKGSNYDTPEPFAIGCIKTIYTTSKDNPKLEDIFLVVNKMYRSENTHESTLIPSEDINMLFWSDEEMEISLSEVMGKCKIFFKSADNFNFSNHQFYVFSTYNAEEKSFKALAEDIKDSLKNISTDKEENKVRPLKTLDIFSGCGGLSQGLSDAGVADVRWAIEKDQAAARAFVKNHANVKMYEGDCNALLDSIMRKEKPSLPQKGDIELLCGGPPCQGFSGLNRFNASRYSNLKNALLFTFLSYCDYYRPKYIVMENVKNFVFHHKGLMLKLAMYCFLQIGYQCTFAILQAGNFGLPQSRRRIILLAAAPDKKLPAYPEPLHVFSKRAWQLDVVIDGTKYSGNFLWKESAPYRTICVRDAIEDLPGISNGENREQIKHEKDATSHFQRVMRENKEMFITDHVCKKMSLLVEARISKIPSTAGADWRDLPNIVVELGDGTGTKKLEYRYEDSTAKLRGVCACAAGKTCDLKDRQENTLIPWCLPHTGHRHNGWAGTYGRLDWNGFFGTTITNPEPLGKQGRVLHPEQNRVVSVRECARSQGFKDKYIFHGSVIDKYRQIGNAVPPLLAEAIGLEIKKVL